MGVYKFSDDLKLGHSGEQVVIDYLISLGGELIDTCDTYHYDFRLSYKGKILCYEVKTDDYCKINNDTGNIFIEFECRGKDSGIYVTNSDWFVYYYKHLGEIWFIRTKDLKELILDNSFRVCQFSGDVNSNTKGYLIHRLSFINHFIVHKLK